MTQERNGSAPTASAADILQSHGYSVRVVQDLKSALRQTWMRRAAFSTKAGPCVLVGHSHIVVDASRFATRADFGWVESRFPKWARVVESGHAGVRWSRRNEHRLQPDSNGVGCTHDTPPAVRARQVGHLPQRTTSSASFARIAGASSRLAQLTRTLSSPIASMTSVTFSDFRSGSSRIVSSPFFSCDRAVINRCARR
jgi:hypothetical protein